MRINIKFARIAATIILFLIISFIFGNSFDVAEVSQGKSGYITEAINKVSNVIFPQIEVTEHFVRKTAHFCEYMLLGFWFVVTFRAYTANVFGFAVLPLFAGLITALIDETLQIFVPGRSGMLTDVWLDFGGIVFGVFMGLVILCFASKRCRKIL